MNKLNLYHERLLIVVSAPSGAGKTTICHRVCKADKNLIYSISATTRPPRVGEREGKDYYFLTETAFKKKIKNNEFLEWAKVHEQYYGTLYGFVEDCFNKKRDVVLDIDVQGGMKIRQNFARAVLIFVLPPSREVLESRLLTRGKDAREEIARRLVNAEQEIKCLSKYDYLVINDRLDKAVRNVQSIIAAEQSKTSMFRNGIKEWGKSGAS